MKRADEPGPLANEPATREARYRKDAALESVLQLTNEALEETERELVAGFDVPRQPTVFIVGAPRSGTTLLAQLMLLRFELGYVSNLTARFWRAPYIGCRLSASFQRDGAAPGIALESDLGATDGPAGPHEFGYFWRRWLPYVEGHEPGADGWRDVDKAALRRHVAAMESVWQRPFLFKNLACSFHIAQLAEAFPRSLFIHCRRDPLEVAQSILRSRVRYFGDKSAWFSLEPRETSWLRSEPYPVQIAGQVFFTRRRIEESFAGLPVERTLTVDYESLCKAPRAQWRAIGVALQTNGGTVVERDIPPPDLSARSAASRRDEDRPLLEEAWAEIRARHGEG